MHRDELQRYLDELLGAPRIKDYCPNGLQVEGRAEVRRLVCGVTASLALIDAAIAHDADGLLVHHGYFWRGEDPRVIATRRRRLARLLGHDLNLYAYHLPLDLHPELGNNAQLARVMGWEAVAHFGDHDVGVIGRLPGPISLDQVARSLAARLGREPLVVGEERRKACSRPPLRWAPNSLCRVKFRNRPCISRAKAVSPTLPLAIMRRNVTACMHWAPICKRNWAFTASSWISTTRSESSLRPTGRAV